MHYYLNEDHSYQICDAMTWANQFDELSCNHKRHVCEDMVDGFHVSTVWLGIDHNYFGGKPLLFETMVFNPAGDDIYCERYSTWNEAESGHQKAIQWVKDGCNHDQE